MSLTNKKTLILLSAGIALVLVAIALLIPRYLVYVSDQTKKIRDEREQDAVLNADRHIANMELDTVAMTAVNYKEKRGRFPKNAEDLAAYELESVGIPWEAGKTGQNNEDTYLYNSGDGQHFLLVMQLAWSRRGGKSITEYFCEDDSFVIRTGTKEPKDYCIGKPVPHFGFSPGDPPLGVK